MQLRELSTIELLHAIPTSFYKNDDYFDWIICPRGHLRFDIIVYKNGKNEKAVGQGEKRFKDTILHSHKCFGFAPLAESVYEFVDWLIAEGFVTLHQLENNIILNLNTRLKQMQQILNEHKKS